MARVGDQVASPSPSRSTTIGRNELVEAPTAILVMGVVSCERLTSTCAKTTKPRHKVPACR